MNYGRYFMPNIGMRLGAPFNTFGRMTPVTTGILSRTLNSLKSFNWKGLLSGANKTLNVVNQTIPLIKQATPMVNNVKSMIRLTKAFSNETISKNNVNGHNQIMSKKKEYVSNDDSPTFFV